MKDGVIIEADKGTFTWHGAKSIFNVGIRIIRNMMFGVLMYVLALIFATIRIASAQDYDAWLTGCEPYRAAVMQILDDEGISRDYYYLMVAESRCKPHAVSNKGARGFWQLMPATAKTYGCSNSFDLECATRAAARYIRRLEAMFKRFDDVIAAYNMGGHNLKRHGKSRQALGLIYTVHRIMQADERRHHDNQ